MTDLSPLRARLDEIDARTLPEFASDPVQVGRDDLDFLLSLARDYVDALPDHPRAPAHTCPTIDETIRAVRRLASSARAPAPDRERVSLDVRRVVLLLERVREQNRHMRAAHASALVEARLDRETLARSSGGAE
jgi:hypothetical protein